MLRLLAVALGGALGSALRYLVSAWALRLFGAAFPVGTLVVNVVGSFLLALLVPLAADGAGLSPALRLALTTGFCGGFTTYSTFNLEALTLFEKGSWGMATMYVALTLVACFGAGVLGLWLGRAWFPAQAA